MVLGGYFDPRAEDFPGFLLLFSFLGLVENGNFLFAGKRQDTFLRGMCPCDC